MARLRCPSCGAEIPEEDVNVAADVAYCRACAIPHVLSGLVAPREVVTDVDFARPPRGAWYRDEGHTIRIGASARSLVRAAVTLGVAAFWNGVVSVFVAFAVAGTMHHALGSAPSWLPAPIMNGAQMSVWMVVGLWAFLTPFIAIGLAMILAFIQSLAGHVEVRLLGDVGEIHTGVGPLGFRRRFPILDVTDVFFEDRSVKGESERPTQHDYVIHVALRDGEVKVGSGVPKERLRFMAGALRAMLVH